MTNYSDNKPSPEASCLEFPHYHRGDVIAEQLGVKVEAGLSDDEARAKLAADGPNILEGKSSDAWWVVLTRQFSSIVVWLLLAAALVSWLTNGISEAAAIAVVLLINALIGFYVEWRANRALDSLKKLTVTSARVRRSGTESLIDAAELVVGDIVILAAGDKVPADGRLLEAANLETGESALTGESLPVAKSIESVSFSSVLTERSSMLYMGTTVVRGRGVAIVTATGIQTELGRIGRLVEKTQTGKTPLERRLATLGKRLVYLVVGIGAAVFFIGLARNDDPALMFEVAVSLAVAAVPEGLPAMTTLTLALGVLRLARNRAIVRKLAAVETLGSTTVICTDKTGTLTENRLVVQEYYLPDGDSVRPDLKNKPPSSLQRLLRASVLCNDAALKRGGSGIETVGDPTETALLVAAEASGVIIDAERSRFERVWERPFDAASKRMIVRVRESSSGRLLEIVKGAPQVVLAMCSFHRDSGGRILPIDGTTRERFAAMNDERANSGLRMLAFAEQSAGAEADPVESGYVFLGFAGMIDAPRKEVPNAIRAATQAGIRIVMLTGDQELTARAIANRLELAGGRELTSYHARDIANSSDHDLAARAKGAHVFARVSPEDKLRIVDALQKAGEVVAVTGDGVNDAPALKRADIGIAMGLRGTEVAKEAADIILTDDNFSTIVSAIEGGRAIYANIIKFVHLLFSHNLGEVLIIFIAVMTSLPLPLLPLQILWINLVTDIFPALALALEPASPAIMARKPRRAGEAILSFRFLVLIGWQGAMLAAIAFAAYIWALGQYGEGAHSRTIALLVVVGAELGHTFNCRSRTRSTFDGFFRNPYIFIAAAIMVSLQAAAFAIQPLADILNLVPPNPVDLVVVAIAVVTPVVVVEIAKLLSKIVRR